LDRPLRHEADYRRFTGRLAKVVTTAPIDGQSAFAGRIVAVEDGTVILEEGRRRHRVPVAQIKRGQLAVEFLQGDVVRVRLRHRAGLERRRQNADS